MHIAYMRYQIRLELSNVKGTLHEDRILPSVFFRILLLSAFCFVLPFSAFFRLVLSPSFPYFRLLSNCLLSSTFCRHLSSVTPCLNAAFCRLLLSAFFRFGSYAAFCLLPHLVFRKPQPPAAFFFGLQPPSTAFCFMPPSVAFCLLKHSALCRFLLSAARSLLTPSFWRVLPSAAICPLPSAALFLLPPEFSRVLLSAP